MKQADRKKAIKYFIELSEKKEDTERASIDNKIIERDRQRLRDVFTGRGMHSL